MLECRSIGGAFCRRPRLGYAGPCSDVIQRPLDHLNGAGLLWRISGGKITAMQSDWATIEINGAQRIIHGRPSPANFPLPWRRRGP
jgi:hypothetical protein